MKTAIVILSLLAMASSAAASGEVTDDSVWVSGDVTVTVDITQNSTTNDAGVTFTDSAGTSDTAMGTLGESSTADNPTATGCDPATTPSPGSHTYKIENGKVKVKNSSGDWVTMTKEKKKAGQRGMERLVIGQPAPHDGWLAPDDFGRPVWLFQNDPAPFTGWLCGPGEEVVTLPAL